MNHYSKYSIYNEDQKTALTAWVIRLANWKVIAHHTFTWEAKLFSAKRSYELFMNRECPEVSYFYAVEQNPSRDGHHVHALWSGCEAVHRSGIWKRWKKRYGRNRIEPVNSVNDVSAYCAKYVTKEGAWWNVKIVSPQLYHRLAAGLPGI